MIVTVQPSQDIANQDSIIIRALNSITTQQAETIVQSVQTSGRAWNVQINVDYDGYLSLLVEPTVQGDEQNDFFVGGTMQRLELFKLHKDSVAWAASFDDAKCLSARLLELIDQQ